MEQETTKINREFIQSLNEQMENVDSNINLLRKEIIDIFKEEEGDPIPIIRTQFLCRVFVVVIHYEGIVHYDTLIKLRQLGFSRLAVHNSDDTLAVDKSDDTADNCVTIELR